MSVEDALKEVKETLKRGGVAVIDEFQRLPKVYHSLIAQWAPNGVLVAVGSSYGVVNEVFDRNSPLLGLFTPLEVDLIPYEEVLAQLRDPVLSVLFRDPCLVDSYEEFAERVKEFSLISKGLIWEVFEEEREEERQLTETYYKVLLLLGEGIWKSSEIAGILQPKGGVATVSSSTGWPRWGLWRKYLPFPRRTSTR